MLPGLLWVLGSVGLEARIDFGGEGVSDLWELRYEGASPVEEADDDRDGMSNYAEGVAGTDPFDRESRLELEVAFPGGNELEFRWQAKAGKLYRVERWDEGAENWEEIAVRLPSLIDQPQSMVTDLVEPGVFRLVVSDFDGDGDGLDAWEENQLGLSDQSPGLEGESGEGHFITALRRLEDPEGLRTADGVRLPRMELDEKKAARFLLRASFGPTDESIARVRELGLTGWIDEQLSLSGTTLNSEMWRNGVSWTAEMARHGWWRMANLAEDQLRQRMAYALSQILVVNLEGGSWVGDNPAVQAPYYDIFTEGAFGPYRDILEQVTYSPVMGFYLSHLKNRKTDDPENPSRFPDENFAREIMQLFSIGLWELNADGTRKIDEQGRFIPTYDNDTITEMAKVFTGMSFTTTNNGRPATSFFDIPRGNDFMNPMKVWEEEHEPGPKSIINGVELDGTQTGEEEVQATLDALMTHRSMAPFLSRLLIQRFTSSNPSRRYLARVSEAWERHRTRGGHLGEVMKAILLDPEALNGTDGANFAGKLREPIVRFAALARAFEMGSSSARFTVSPYGLRSDFGQYPMIAQSVFNFYSPNHAPNGEFRRAGMFSPEMELASMSHLLQTDSRFLTVVVRGHYRSVELDYSEELLLADDPEALLDRVDLLLTGGRLSPESRAAILPAIEAEPTDQWRVKVAIYLVSQAMECVVLR